MRVDQRIQSVPASHGLQWLLQSAALLKLGWRPLSGVAAFWLLASMMVVIPVIGQLMLALLTPLLTAGVLLAFDALARGQWPGPHWLLRAWQHPKARSVLIALGLWGILGSLIAVAFVASWMGQQLTEAELMALLERPDQALTVLRNLQPGLHLWLAVLVFVVVLSSLVFAIPLAIFGEQGMAMSLWASLKAVLANVLPALVFGVLLLGAFAITALITSALVGALANVGGAAGAVLAQVLVLMLGMALQMWMAGAQYVAFCQIFGWTAVAPDQGDGALDA